MRQHALKKERNHKNPANKEKKVKEEDDYGSEEDHNNS